MSDRSESPAGSPEWRFLQGYWDGGGGGDDDGDGGDGGVGGEDSDLEGSIPDSAEALGSKPFDITKPHDKSKHRDNLPQTLIVDLSVDSSVKTQALDQMETGVKKYPKWQFAKTQGPNPSDIRSPSSISESDDKSDHEYNLLHTLDRMDTGEDKYLKWQPGKSEYTSRLQQAWVLHSTWASIDNVCKISSGVSVNKLQCEDIADHFKVIADVLQKLGLKKDFVSGQAWEGRSSIQTNLAFDEMHFNRMAHTFERHFFSTEKSVHEVDFRTEIHDVSSMFEDYVHELDALDGSNEESLSTKSKIEEGFQDFSLRMQRCLDEFLSLLLGVLKQGEDLVLFHSRLEGVDNMVVEQTGLYGERFIRIHKLLYKLLDFYACLEHCEGTKFARGYLSQLDSYRDQSLLYYLNSNYLWKYASLCIPDGFLNIEHATTISKMLERPNCAVKVLYIESSSKAKVDQVEIGKCRLMVIAALSKCMSITSLTVCGSNEEEIHELCKSVSINKVLENLVISNDGPLADSNALGLSTMLKENHSLKSFTLEFGQITHECIIYLGAMLVENSSLDAMYLRYKVLGKIHLKDLMRSLVSNNLGASNVIISLNGRRSIYKLWELPMGESIIAAQLFRKSRTLTHFFIEFRDLLPSVACEILDSLKKNKTLKILDLQGFSNFGNNFEVAACLEAMLTENSTLEELKVDLRMWDGFYLKYLLRPLMTNKDGETCANISLKRLHILNYNCDRGCKEVEFIAQMLCTNKTLSHFSMNNASLDTFDVYGILDSLKINKSLQVLNLQECKGLDDAQVEVAFIDLLVNHNFSLSTIMMLGRNWDISTFMNLLVHYNFSLSMMRKHRSNWDIESCIEPKLKHPIQIGDLWSSVGCASESSIVCNVHDLKQVVGKLQLKEGERSTKEACGSPIKAFDKRKSKVEAKDERPRLFLSYSNEMRDFAIQLSMELKLSKYNVVDQTSVNFFEVVNQCQLAIVVLTDKYVSSKPSMLELHTIVKSKKTNNPTLKVYPLFYKLTLKDLQKACISASIIGGERIVPLRFLLEGKNKVLKQVGHLVHDLRQGRVDVGQFCEQFCEVLRSSWPHKGLEFEKNATSEEGYFCPILEEIFHYMPAVKECNSDHISGHRGKLEMESKLSLRQMKSLFQESLLKTDFYLRRKFNMAQYLQEKYIQYSSFEEMCPLHLSCDQKHEYSIGRIAAALFPITFLYHFTMHMLQGPCDGNFLPMLKVVADLVAQKMQQECNKNGVQTLMFFDFVDYGAPIDPRRTIAMCQNFSTKTSDGSKQLVIVQNDLTGAYYYQCDKALDLGNSTLNESIGVIGVQVTSTEIHVDNIHEDGSSYSGVLGDFSFKFDFDENKQCAAKAFGDLAGARFLSKSSGIKCSPLLVIALASAIQKTGLTLTWSNGKGHMEFDPKIALKVEVEACACQIQYTHNINQLGVEIEWGTGRNSCTTPLNQTIERGANEIVNQQVVFESIVDQNVVTSISNNVASTSIDCVSSMQNQIAIYNATAQSKTKHTFGIKAVGSGVDISYEKHDSKAKKIMIIAANDILKRHYEFKGGFERISNLSIKHPNLKNHLLRCQLHEVHECNYLVVSNVHSTGHVSVYLAIEQNEVVPKFEIIWITDILIEGGEYEIKRIFETGLKGRELTVKRNGSNFTQVGNPSKPLAKIVPGYQESLVEFKSRFPNNAITSSMIQISEPNLVGMLKSKNEWRHIIGPQGRYGASHKYWWNATFMQAIVYSRTMYKSGKLMKTCIELPINAIGHIGFCSIEEDSNEDEFAHLCGPMVSRGKFSRPPGSLLGNKVLWGGLEIEPEELENLYFP